ncbi:MAG: hypothetical protein MR006_00960 [Arcanobacterium sp.]|nr:hypothetical protein [Arcanobacterium sp.]MDY5589176.1 hypothetical protein [Arcanobacterium sp.]
MCHAVKCNKCGKTTWEGCGRHIDRVKASVPAEQWCTCSRGNQQSATPKPAQSLFSRLFK